MQKLALLWATLCVFGAEVSLAQSTTTADSLTAERVVALARTSSPLVRIAQSRVLEARGRLAGARAFGQSNPTWDGVANRDDAFERRTQWELNVPVGLGLGWLARSAEASAELGREQHLVADARRGAVGAALAAFYRTLHAVRRVELANARRSLAADLSSTAVERHRAGQVPRFEVLVAETEQVRADSELLAEEQSLARARIVLAAALGLPAGAQMHMAGNLADRMLLTTTLGEPAPEQRADVLAAERELRAARASRAVARAEWLPGLGVRVDYGHDAGEVLVRSGVALSVPLFQHGQASGAAARARELRATQDLERVRNAASVEMEQFALGYAAAARAADQLGSRALPLVEESEGMVRESYRAGKIALPALLVVRRDLLDTRREYTDRLLEAALAGIDLAVARGHFQ